MFMILSFYLFFVFFYQLVTLYLSFSLCFRHVAKIAAKIAKKTFGRRRRSTLPAVRQVCRDSMRKNYSHCNLSGKIIYSSFASSS